MNTIDKLKLLGYDFIDNDINNLSEKSSNKKIPPITLIFGPNAHLLEDQFNLSDFLYIIKNSDLNTKDKLGNNPLINILNDNTTRSVAPEEISLLIKNTPMDNDNKYLLIYLKNAGEDTDFNINIKPEDVKTLIKKSRQKNLYNIVDIYSNDNNMTPLMWYFFTKNPKKLNIPIKLIEYLIKNSNLNDINKLGQTALMFLGHNKNHKDLLPNYLIDYMIKNTNLNQIDYNQSNAFMCLLVYQSLNTIKLNNSQLIYLLNNSDNEKIEKNKSWQSNYPGAYNLYLSCKVLKEKNILRSSIKNIKTPKKIKANNINNYKVKI